MMIKNKLYEGTCHSIISGVMSGETFYGVLFLLYPAIVKNSQRGYLIVRDKYFKLM